MMQMYKQFGKFVKYFLDYRKAQILFINLYLHVLLDVIQRFRIPRGSPIRIGFRAPPEPLLLLFLEVDNFIKNLIILEMFPFDYTFKKTLEKYIKKSRKYCLPKSTVKSKKTQSMQMQSLIKMNKFSIRLSHKLYHYAKAA